MGNSSRTDTASKGRGEVGGVVNNNNSVGQQAAAKDSTDNHDGAALGDLARQRDAGADRNVANSAATGGPGPINNAPTESQDGRSDTGGNRHNVSLLSGVSSNVNNRSVSSLTSPLPSTEGDSSAECAVRNESDSVQGLPSLPSLSRTGGPTGHPAGPPHVRGNPRGQFHYRPQVPQPGGGRSFRPPHQPAHRGQHVPRGRGFGHNPRNMAPPQSPSQKRQAWQQPSNFYNSPRGPMGPAAMGQAFGGNPLSQVVQSNLAVLRGLEELNQKLANGPGGPGSSGGRGNPGRVGAGVPGHFPPAAAGHFSQATNSQGWPKRPRFSSTTSSQSSKSNSGFSASRAANAKKPE